MCVHAPVHVCPGAYEYTHLKECLVHNWGQCNLVIFLFQRGKNASNFKDYYLYVKIAAGQV